MFNYKAKQPPEKALQLAEKEDKRKAKKKMRNIPSACVSWCALFKPHVPARL